MKKPLITVSANNSSSPAAPHNLSARYIIAQPNQSSSWQANKQLIVGVGIVSGLIATVFSLVGAWLILPFAGIEIAALGGSLYSVCRRLNLRHVLRFYDDSLIIEKGFGQPQQVWQLNKHLTSIFIERQLHPWDPIKISLCCHHKHLQNIHFQNTHFQNKQSTTEQIPIGDFLNREDSQQLLEVLREQGLRVRNDSVNGQIEG